MLSGVLLLHSFLLLSLGSDMHVVQKSLERYLLPDARQMVHELTEATGPGFRKLNDAVSCLGFMLLSVFLLCVSVWLVYP